MDLILLTFLLGAVLIFEYRFLKGMWDASTRRRWAGKMKRIFAGPFENENPK